MTNHIRSIILTIILPAISLISISCGSDGNEQEITQTNRTVLVYMIANNNLNANALADLDEMEDGAAALPAGTRWLVYYAPKGDVPTLRELSAGRKWKILKTYTVQPLSVRLERLEEVLADTRRLAPAAKYGLVLWSHANGWLEDGVTEPSVSTLSFGDDGGRKMNITTLRSALEKNRMEFIYADCCDLASAEVAYELRNCASTFAGSAIELHADGMPYDITLRYLAEGDVISAAKMTFSHYKNDVAMQYPFCTLSVIDLTRMELLAEETARVYRSTKYPEGYQPARLGLGTCRLFDLRHFIEALNPENLSRWNNILNQTVLYAENLDYINDSSTKITAHCGLSTFILRNSSSADEKNYSNLQWYTDVARFQPF